MAVIVRGTDERSGSLFHCVDLKARITARRWLCEMRRVVSEALASLDAEFEALFTDFGHSFIPWERLIRATPIQILFSARSDRQLMEKMR